MTTRRVFNGPAWADALVSRYRRELGVPEGKAGLPIPYGDAYVRAFGRRSGFMSVGSGFYGAVYPTRRPGVVLKLTRDSSEAEVTAATLSMSKPPIGMVRFYEIRELPAEGVPPPGGQKTWHAAGEDDPAVYAIWREDVPEVGADEGLKLPVGADGDAEDRYEALVDYLDDLFELWRSNAFLADAALDGAEPEAIFEARWPTKKAREFLGRVLPKPKPVPLSDALEFREPARRATGALKQLGARAVPAEAVANPGISERIAGLRSRVQRLMAGRRRRTYELEEAVRKSPEGQLKALVKGEGTAPSQGAMCLAVASEIVKRLSSSPLDTVGQAMGFYLDQGILIGDIHTSNVGFAMRGDEAVAVITDPGQALFLTDEFDDLEIPEIPARKVNHAAKRRLLR